MLTDDITKYVNDAMKGIHYVWARSMFALLMLFFGMWVGEIRTENRIVADCKYAGVFRTDIQTYTCQRKL